MTCTVGTQFSFNRIRGLASKQTGAASVENGDECADKGNLYFSICKFVFT